MPLGFGAPVSVEEGARSKAATLARSRIRLFLEALADLAVYRAWRCARMAGGFPLHRTLNSNVRHWRDDAQPVRRVAVKFPKRWRPKRNKRLPNAHCGHSIRVEAKPRREDFGACMFRRCLNRHPAVRVRPNVVDLGHDAPPRLGRKSSADRSMPISRAALRSAGTCLNGITPPVPPVSLALFQLETRVRCTLAILATLLGPPSMVMMVVAGSMATLCSGYGNINQERL